MFFNEDGTLNFRELLADTPSFRTIMEDGMISQDEVDAQFEKVNSLLRSMEARYDAAVMKDVMTVMAESCVLYAIQNYYSLQGIMDE